MLGILPVLAADGLEAEAEERAEEEVEPAAEEEELELVELGEELDEPEAELDELEVEPTADELADVPVELDSVLEESVEEESELEVSELESPEELEESEDLYWSAGELLVLVDEGLVVAGRSLVSEVEMSPDWATLSSLVVRIAVTTSHVPKARTTMRTIVDIVMILSRRDLSCSCTSI